MRHWDAQGQADNYGRRLVSEQAYHVTLWRTRSGFLFGTVTEPVAENVQCWLDLPDRAQTTWQVADLIRRSGGDMDEIERYRLDVRDMVTGEHVSSLKPSFPDLEALRDGSLSTSPAASPGLGLQEVSDEVLLREVARRLRER